MANYSTLITAVQNVIKTNGTNAITGALLQSVLLSMIDSLGVGGYQYVGIALPNTNPGTPDKNIVYVAGAGTYPNFGGHVVPDGAIGIFAFNGTWTRSNIVISQPNAILYGECATGANVAAKTVAAENFRLFVGTQFRVKFVEVNTAANPTLNINGTGAYPIIYDGEVASASNSWEAGETVLVYYDGQQYQASFSGGVKIENSFSGGSEKALSAEMGKILYDLIAETSLDLFSQTTEPGCFFVDAALNIGAKLDSDGFHAKNILEYEIINS